MSVYYIDYCFDFLRKISIPLHTIFVSSSPSYSFFSVSILLSIMSNLSSLESSTFDCGFEWCYDMLVVSFISSSSSLTALCNNSKLSVPSFYLGAFFNLSLLNDF